MKLLGLELSKTLANRGKLIVLALFLLLYVVMGFSSTYYSYGGTENYQTYVSLVEQHTGELDEAQGQLSTDLYTEAEHKYGAGEAIDHYKMQDPELKFHSDYADFTTDVHNYYYGEEPGEQDIDNLIGIEAVEQKLAELKAAGEQDGYEYARYEQQLATDHVLGAPTFQNVSFWESLFSNWGGMNVLLLLLFPLAYFVAPIFTQEVRTGMDNIVLCSKKGRREIVTAKLLTAVITAIVLSVLFLAGTFVGTAAATGSVAGADCALRCLSGFRTALYDLTIGQFAGIAALWIVLVSIACSSVALVVSSLTRNQAAAFGMSFIMLLVGMSTEIFGTGLKDLLWPIVDFSFNTLAKVSTIFGQTTTYNLFGQPVSYAAAGGIVAVILFVVFTAVVYAAQRKRAVR